MKGKKLKEAPLSSQKLYNHSQSIYSLLLKPVVCRTDAWKEASINIKQLVDCLSAYHVHLKSQAKTVQRNRLLDHPVRTIDECATIEHRQKYPYTVQAQYLKLGDALRTRNESVVFGEDKHLDKPFESAWHRYFANLQLSSAIDIIRFCPGGHLLQQLASLKFLKVVQRGI